MKMFISTYLFRWICCQNCNMYISLFGHVLVYIHPNILFLLALKVLTMPKASGVKPWTTHCVWKRCHFVYLISPGIQKFSKIKIIICGFKA